MFDPTWKFNPIQEMSSSSGEILLKKCCFADSSRVVGWFIKRNQWGCPLFDSNKHIDTQ